MNGFNKYFIVLILLLSSSLVIPKENPENRILYLNLKLIDGQVALEDYRIVAGKLKQARTGLLTQRDVYLKMVNQNNIILYETGINDPSKIRYEYGSKDGTIENKIVTQDTARFTVRVPYHPSLHEVQFFRAQKSLVRTNSLRKHDQSMGSIRLDLDRDDVEK